MAILILLFSISFIIGGITWIQFFGNYHLRGNNTLKINSWHFQYLNWLAGTFGAKFTIWDFKSLCSYSWLIFFMITISPLIMVIKFIFFIGVGLTKVIEKISKPVTQFCENQLDKWVVSAFESLEDTEEFSKTKRDIAYILYRAKLVEESPLSFLQWYAGFTRKQKLRYKKILLQYDELPKDNQETLRDKLIARRDAIEAEKRLEASRKREEEIKREESIKSLAKKSKHAISGLSIAAGLYVCTLLYQVFRNAFYFLVYQVDWPYTFHMWGQWTLKGLVIVLVGVLVITLPFTIGYAIRKLVCWIGPYCIPCEERRETLYHLFRQFFRAMVQPFIWVWNAIVFGISTLAAYKSDNCPMIIWEEE